MKKIQNTSFICENCGRHVEAIKRGSYRNHCSYCLYSKHLDVIPGDRASQCQGLMKPIGQRLHPKKGLQILHQCQTCNHKHYNRIDESLDDMDKIIKLDIY